jgi:CheY-like chemotaxis protein
MTNVNLPVPGARPCVMIIDDEEAVRQALRSILQSEYVVLEADSVDAGLEVLRQNRADLITLDLRMPGRDGLEALRELRGWEEYLHTPIIMITGHASFDGACEALRLGATDFLQKPFGVDQLKTSVRNSLKRGETGRLPDIRHGKNISPPDAATDKMVRLGKASAAFVHDLASPLQVMSVLSTVCAQKLALPPEAARNEELREAMAQMERLLAWASELVRGWQTIAVPQGPGRETMSVTALLDRVMETMEPYAKLNGVTLTRRPLFKPLEVTGDRLQLERALVNIGLNGIKASTTRGRTVEIGVVRFGDEFVFRFTDTGEGFTTERMREVLNGDPFDATAKTRRGLGLFIADWIAVNHGGKLQFISEKGVGTTVELFLPAG